MGVRRRCAERRRGRGSGRRGRAPEDGLLNWRDVGRGRGSGRDRMQLLVDDRVEDLHEGSENGGDVLLHQQNQLVPSLGGDEVGARTGQLFRGCLEKEEPERDRVWTPHQLRENETMTNPRY